MAPIIVVLILQAALAAVTIRYHRQTQRIRAEIHRLNTEWFRNVALATFAPRLRAALVRSADAMRNAPLQGVSVDMTLALVEADTVLADADAAVAQELASTFTVGGRS